MALKNPFNKKTSEPEPLIEAAPEPEAVFVVPTLSDEGVPYRIYDLDMIINLSDGILDRRRRDLHIGGATFAHVSEAADGAWIYRNDK